LIYFIYHASSLSNSERLIFSSCYICATIRCNILHFLADTSFNSNHSPHAIKPDHIINHDHTAQHNKRHMDTDTQLAPWHNCPRINFSLGNIHGRNFGGNVCMFGYGSFRKGVNFSQENFWGISIFQRNVQGIFWRLIFQEEMGVWIPVQGYKSLHPMVMIQATLLNTHTQTDSC